MKKVISTLVALLLIATAAAMGQASAPAKLSPEKAGYIGAPMGRIAYVREGDIWVMDWDGSKQMKVVTAQNADGRLSWAPDGKRIAFSRRGTVDLKGPDGLGGQHRVYDIFIGYLDSAAYNTNFWRRITENLGSRHPEWSPDGKSIVITKDLNAYFANAILPNYQTCIIDSTGAELQTIAYDKQVVDRLSSMATFSPDGRFVFMLHKDGAKPTGLVISSPTILRNLSDAEIQSKGKILTGATAPAWSPDGDWIAYVSTEISNPGIFIIRPDLSEKFLIYKPSAGQTIQTYPLSWSPSSKWITFATGDGSIWIIDITGNGLKQIVPTGDNKAPAWSKTE